MLVNAYGNVQSDVLSEWRSKVCSGMQNGDLLTTCIGETYLGFGDQNRRIDQGYRDFSCVSVAKLLRKDLQFSGCTDAHLNCQG